MTVVSTISTQKHVWVDCDLKYSNAEKARTQVVPVYCFITSLLLCPQNTARQGCSGSSTTYPKKPLFDVKDGCATTHTIKQHMYFLHIVYI